jgi:hypothetical protein
MPGAPKRNALLNLLRGNVIREVSNSLPQRNRFLLVYAELNANRKSHIVSAGSKPCD